jgi:hypothetical protein
MLETVGKALLTAAFIVVLSEVARRSTWLAAVMVALPLATILTVGLTFLSTRDASIANQFAASTFLMVLPGLSFFVILPLAQRLGAGFWTAFAIAVASTLLATWGWTLLLRALGIKL